MIKLQYSEKFKKYFYNFSPSEMKFILAISFFAISSPHKPQPKEKSMNVPVREKISQFRTI